MFKKLAQILIWISVVGVCAAMDKKNHNEVDNPIPLLMQEVAPNFLQGEHYTMVCKSFEERASQFRAKCLKAMSLPDFPEQLKDSWQEKLDLLTNTYTSFKEKNESDIEAIYKKLFDITENGFFTDSKIAIYGTENSQELNAILDDFWQNLWQAREITDCFVILSKKSVPSFEIPGICEAFDRSISYIRRFAIPENTEEEKEALRIEARLNKILSAYQYMEFGIAVKTNENMQRMERIFINDRNQKLKDIMMDAFGSTQD